MLERRESEQEMRPKIAGSESGVALWATANAVACPHGWEVFAGFEQRNNRLMSSTKVALADVLRKDGLCVWWGRRDDVKAD